jgi:hypothetical protein
LSTPGAEASSATGFRAYWRSSGRVRLTADHGSSGQASTARKPQGLSHIKRSRCVAHQVELGNWSRDTGAGSRSLESEHWSRSWSRSRWRARQWSQSPGQASQPDPDPCRAGLARHGLVRLASRLGLQGGPQCSDRGLRVAP